MWEEFTQSIYTFIEDKKNLAQHTQGKKKATLIVIPSVRFTKLIVYYLQSKHKFHPRPGSPLHLPNEEPVLGYLNFSAKGTKQEVFGMPIPNDLITDDIRGEQYYNVYLEKVAKHQRYLAGEEVSDPDSLAPKPAKATKPKVAKQSKPLAPKAAPIIKPAAAKASKSQQPKHAHAKPQEKKRKLVTETSETPSPAKRSKDGVPDKEPLYGDEEANTQREIKESLKEVHGAHRGPLPPVVFREPDSRKFQPLLEVQGHDESSSRTSTQTEPSGHDESSSLYAELGLTDSETESDEEVLPVIQTSQHQSSHVVHAGPNLEHIDFEVIDTSIQQNPEQMDEEFTTTAYLNEDKPGKTNTESEIQSMVTVPIHQDTSYVPLMTTPVIDLAVSQPVSTTIQAPLPTSTATRISELEQHMADMVEANQALEERLDKQGNMLYNLENLDIPYKVRKVVDEIITDAVDWAIQAPFRDRFRDLPEDDMKKILHHRMWESNSYQAHEDHKMLKKKKRHDSPKTPPGSPPHQPPPPPPPAGSSGTPGASEASGSSQLPPPPLPLSTNQSDQSKSTAAPSSSKTAASAKYTAWTTTDSRLKPSVSSIPEDLHMDTDLAPDEQVYSSDDEDIGHDHIPKASALASTNAPPPENSLLAQTGGMATFMDWYCKRQGLTEVTQKDLEGPAFEIVKVFHPDVIHIQYQIEECHKLLTDQVDDAILQYNVSKPLPLGGPQGQVTIQSNFFFNKYLEYLIYGSKGSRPALSISKMKAVYYPDVGLEQMKIVLRRADLQEHIIAERDFKYLYPSDFEDLYILNLQGHLNHLPPKDKKILTTAVNLWTRNLVIRQRVEDFQLGIESYQTQLNLTKPRWDATGFEYKHDFIVIDSPRAVTFWDKYGVQMIMRFNEINKFSDGTLQQIDEVLDYRVKEFKVNRMNPGLNTQFWSTKDVDRSKEFMFAIQKRLKTRRIFHNLESFVGGRVKMDGTT
ncbi:hypothetical protein Tco_1204263 [Tanacetum coccineum]